MLKLVHEIVIVEGLAIDPRFWRVGFEAGFGKLGLIEIADTEKQKHTRQISFSFLMFCAHEFCANPGFETQVGTQLWKPMWMQNNIVFNNGELCTIH
jgi:hypothetical protein